MNTRTEDFIDDRSARSILRDLMHEVPTLFTKELALARAEMRENLAQTRRGALEVSSGGVVLAGGFIVLLMAAVYALSQVMAPWLAALLVGGVAAVVGYGMVKAGMRHFGREDLRPDRTIDAVRKDAEAIRGGRHEYH